MTVFFFKRLFGGKRKKKKKKKKDLAKHVHANGYFCEGTLGQLVTLHFCVKICVVFLHAMQRIQLVISRLKLFQNNCLNCRHG